MIDRQAKISEILGRLRGKHPSGFAVALHLQFSAARYLFQSYNADWIELYSRQGMVLRDPTIRWAVAHTGAVRWSELTVDADGAEVMRQAADHGLRYGFTLAIADTKSRSFGCFARPDREPDGAEIESAAFDLAALHRLTVGLAALSPRFHAALKEMSIYLTRG